MSSLVMLQVPSITVGCYRNRFKSRNRTDISRIAAASEHVDQNKSGIGPWRTRIISLQAGVDGHSQSLKEVMHRLGLLSQSPWNMHRQIYEKQQSLLRQSFQKFVNSARGDTSTQPGMRGSARPMQDKKVEVLSEIEIFYAIRAKAAELEDQCIQSGQCRDARSAVASLEHLVLLHKDTVAGRYVILLILNLLTNDCAVSGPETSVLGSVYAGVRG